MSLRKTLEAIWNDSCVRCPRHVTWWTEEEQVGRRSTRATGELGEPLYYAKGKLLGPDKPDKGLKRREREP